MYVYLNNDQKMLIVISKLKYVYNTITGLQIVVNSLGAMWAPNVTNITRPHTHSGAHSCKNKI
jgi:hypothetical protein